MERDQGIELGCCLRVRGCCFSRMHFMGTLGVWSYTNCRCCWWNYSSHIAQRWWHLELGYSARTRWRYQRNQLGSCNWALHAESWAFNWLAERFRSPSSQVCDRCMRWKDKILVLHWKQICYYKRDCCSWWLDPWCSMEQQHWVNVRHSSKLLRRLKSKNLEENTSWRFWPLKRRMDDD